MGNVNWVILGFRPEKCPQFFLGPRTSDFRPGYRISYIKGSKKQFFLILNFVQTKKTIFHSFFHNFFSRFSIYLAPSGAKYCEKGLAAMWKSFGGFGKVLEKLNFQAVIKSAASAASRKPKIKETKIQGSALFRRPTVPVARPTPSSHRAPSSGRSPGSWIP